MGRFGETDRNLLEIKARSDCPNPLFAIPYIYEGAIMAKHYDRSIRLDPSTYKRIRSAVSKHAIPVSAWMRIAFRNHLNQENAKSEISQLRDELAANFSRILDHCRTMSNAQQSAIALVDTLIKFILSVSPEPGEQAQAIGKRRYQQFLKSVAAALQGDVLRAFADLDEDKRKPN